MVSKLGSGKVRPSGGQLTGKKWRDSEAKERMYCREKSWKVCKTGVVLSMRNRFDSIKDVIFPKRVGC